MSRVTWSKQVKHSNNCLSGVTHRVVVKDTVQNAKRVFLYILVKKLDQMPEAGVEQPAKAVGCESTRVDGASGRML